MASVVVKTIWQSKEFHQAGDTPARVERRLQLGPEAPGGMTGPAKGITKKKKAVSFHGWVCHTCHIGPQASTAPCRAQAPPWLLVGGREGGREEAERIVGSSQRQTGRWWPEGGRKVGRQQMSGKPESGLGSLGLATGFICPPATKSKERAPSSETPL